MADIEKVINGLERCKVCDMSILSYGKGKPAYLECEYTVGLYCGRDRLINDTLKVLKEYRKTGEYIPCIVKTKTGKWDGEKCSVCGSQYIGSAPNKWKFCPDCGAIMIKEVTYESSNTP